MIAARWAGRRAVALLSPRPLQPVRRCRPLPSALSRSVESACRCLCGWLPLLQFKFEQPRSAVVSDEAIGSTAEWLIVAERLSAIRLARCRSHSFSFIRSASPSPAALGCAVAHSGSTSRRGRTPAAATPDHADDAAAATLGEWRAASREPPIAADAAAARPQCSLPSWPATVRLLPAATPWAHPCSSAWTKTQPA